MKILVVGHFCLDRIHSESGKETDSYGGIYYSLITLAGLLGKEDSVVPVFGVNRSDYGPLMEHLGGFPNIDTRGIFKFDEPTNTVELFYGNKAERRERSTNIAAPIPYRKIRRHLSADGILLNMISGSDLTLETLDQIRMTVRSHGIPIHFDFHSLTLGVAADSGRVRRPVVDWRRWAFMTDTVQLNEQEAAGLSEHSMTERELAGHLLTLSVKGVVITKGESGATIYTNEKKKIVSTDIPARGSVTVADATGCGDVFGAAFFLEYLRTKDLQSGAKAGNEIAGRKIATIGSNGLYAILSGKPLDRENT